MLPCRLVVSDLSTKHLILIYACIYLYKRHIYTEYIYELVQEFLTDKRLVSTCCDRCLFAHGEKFL